MQNLVATPSLNGPGRMLGLLAVVFAMPFVLAAGLYLSGWRPAVAAAHGTLVEPPQSLAGLVLGEDNGRPVRLAGFGARWTLLYAAPAECAAECLRSLYAMRQVHVAQGREQPRVQRVFVAGGAAVPLRKTQLQQQFPGLNVVTPVARADWPAGYAWPGKILLVDPQGNLLMTYPAAADPAGMRKDLARLLAYSWVG